MSSKNSRIVLPVLELEQNDKPYVKSVLKGVKELQVFRVNADSNSDSQCSFSWQPPSQNTILDRRFELEVGVKIVNTSAGTQAFDSDGAFAVGAADVAKNVFFDRSNVRGVVAGTPTAAQLNSGLRARIGNNLAPRQFPLASIMDTIDLTINGTHFTVSPNQYIHAVMKYTSPEYREKHFEDCAHHPDVTTEYANTLGHTSHPLNMLDEGGLHGETPRGVMFGKEQKDKYWKLKQTNVANDSIAFTLREPLFISPLMMEYGHGMTNINDLSVQINWNSNLARSLSLIDRDAAGIIVADRSGASRNVMTATTNVVMDTDVPAKLVMRYYTPQSDIKIPNEIVLPYKQPKIQTMAAVNVAKGASHTFNGNSVRLNQIPECVYIFARQSRASQSAATTDIPLEPTKLSVQWGVKTGILNGANEDDLWQISKENGLDYESYRRKRGGFAIKLVYGKDIPLDDNEAPGTRGDYNWQVDLTASNNHALGGGIDAELVQVFIYSGHALISPNECAVQTGVLDLRDNVEATDMGDSYHSSYGGSLSGGSPIGGAFNPSHLIKKTKDVYKLAKDLKPVADAAMGAYEKYKTRA